MRVAVIGGGPAGLYFALLLKKARPASKITVFERNPAGATYGWGVVFSDRSLTSFREADFKTYSQITNDFVIWDAIDVRYRDEVVRCGGQVFSGIERKTLLGILANRCEELGVELAYEHEVETPPDDHDLVVAADGVRSALRTAHSQIFQPGFEEGSARYIWFGTERVFDSFTFAFRENEHGYFQAHAYPFSGTMSTFIVECDERTWRNAELDQADEATSIGYCEELFAGDLRNQALISNNSKWINFATLTNRRWHHDNIVLIGDAAHTAHFSIGSGTKLAMEDSIALVNALETKPDVASALVEYQLERKPRVERFQEAARQSQDYFENTALYRDMEPMQFAFNLLSRSGRIDYDELRVRDKHFVAAVDRWFIRRDMGPAAPPSFAPLRLRELEIPNRVCVTPRPAYDAAEGTPPTGLLDHTWEMGAGLVFTGPVAVSAHGRITPGCPGLYDDLHTDAWRDQLQGPAAVTLNHAGPRGSTRPRDRAVDMPLDAGAGWTPIAASSMTYSRCSMAAAAIDDRRKREVVEDFGSAARRADEAGFSLLELHMGHGYLLGSFLSPATNPVPLGERLGYPLEVLASVRAAWPEAKPLGVAMNAADWVRGGTTLDDAIETAVVFREHGCDVIRVLAGQTKGDFAPRYDPYFLAYYAERIRNVAKIATIATGDITTVDRVNTLVAGGRADLCLLRSIP